MRVVAGSARGLRLVAPPGEGTRPTTDRVREATFNALHSLGAVVGARVLDGFAGSGALGIEALSRGALHCTFVDLHRGARAAVEENLASTGLADRATVLTGDLRSHLAGDGPSWDLVLLDPPHALDAWPALLEAVADRVTDDAVVVAESDRPVVDDGTPGGRWSVIREKRYGGTVVQMFRPRPADPAS